MIDRYNEIFLIHRQEMLTACVKLRRWNCFTFFCIRNQRGKLKTFNCEEPLNWQQVHWTRVDWARATMFHATCDSSYVNVCQTEEIFWFHALENFAFRSLLSDFTELYHRKLPSCQKQSSSYIYIYYFFHFPVVQILKYKFIKYCWFLFCNYVIFNDLIMIL